MASVKVYLSNAIQEQRRKDIKQFLQGHASLVSWWKANDIRCVKCGVHKYEHAANAHPFFNNNLEMLEWLAR